MDELGRVVIPKEIRRIMRIRQGDPLEIYTAPDGEIIFKKYSPVEDISETAAQFAEAAYKIYGCTVIVMDNDMVIACTGGAKKDTVEHKISQEVKNLIDSRQLYIWRPSENKIPVLEGKQGKYFAKTVMPIFSYGDIVGAVSVIAYDNLLYSPTEMEIKLTQTAAVFLGKQVDNYN